MTEFLYHALGICGEHWHPNLINVSLFGMLTYGSWKLFRNKTIKEQ